MCLHKLLDNAFWNPPPKVDIAIGCGLVILVAGYFIIRELIFFATGH